MPSVEYLFLSSILSISKAFGLSSRGYDIFPRTLFCVVFLSWLHPEEVEMISILSMHVIAQKLTVLSACSGTRYDIEAIRIRQPYVILLHICYSYFSTAHLRYGSRYACPSVRNFLKLGFGWSINISQMIMDILLPKHLDSLEHVIGYIACSNFRYALLLKLHSNYCLQVAFFLCIYRLAVFHTYNENYSLPVPMCTPSPWMWSFQPAKGSTSNNLQ